MTIKLDDISRNMTDALTGGLQSGRALLTHPTLKGDASEHHWITWLRALLPRRYAVERAVIIDQTGAEAEQIDVVVFDSQYSPVLYAEHHVRVLPAESVYAVFEVKQDLCLKHIEAAAEKAESVRRLKRTSAPIVHAGGTIPTPKPAPVILAGILSLESSWTPPLGAPLQSALSATSPDGLLDFGFAARDGYFTRDVAPSAGVAPTWTMHPGQQHALHFLLHLLGRLAQMGTAPAIDFTAYAAGLTP
jgi:hypothetical protein